MMPQPRTTGPNHSWTTLALAFILAHTAWQAWQITASPYPAHYDYDEGVYAETAAAAAGGSRLYMDAFLSQPPLLPLTLATAYHLAGHSLVTARECILVFSLFWLVSIFAIPAADGRPRAGALAVVALVGTPTFLTAAHTIQMEAPSEALAAAAVALARAIAKEQGVEFERGAAEDLAEFVAADLMRLKTEIDKLATYAAGRKQIRHEDVSALVVSEKTTTVWELADLLATRQGKKALEFLDRLLREGEEPLQMLGAITWMYRKLIEASEVRGVTNGYQAARALAMRPEQAELALQSARKIPKARLLAGLGALQRADDRLKGGREDARAVMEFLVTELTCIEAKVAGG
jgi:hypothetical protein